MDSDLIKKAVSAALNGNWAEAISLNEEILKEESDNIDAVNRLARAYAETGKLSKAKELSQKALKIDPFNTIANKSLKKWKGLKPDQIKASGICPQATFLEEPGKTKMVSLLHLGNPTLLANLDCGDEVILDTHSHRVSVVTQDAKYIGRLPDDLSARLKYFIAQGNKYQLIVKSADLCEVKIFMREVERVTKLADTPSFPAEKIDFIAHTPDNLPTKDGEAPCRDEDADEDSFS